VYMYYIQAFLLGKQPNHMECTIHICEPQRLGFYRSSWSWCAREAGYVLSLAWCLDDARSTFKLLCIGLVGGNLSSWRSKKQNGCCSINIKRIIYLNYVRIICGLIWLRIMLTELLSNYPPITEPIVRTVCVFSSKRQVCHLSCTTPILKLKIFLPKLKPSKVWMNF
jgi:hypothetical protein